MKAYTTPPPQAAAGLDLFAAAWLERWIAHGGSITVRPDGTSYMFAQANHRDVPSADPIPDDASDMCRGMYEGIVIGRTRELVALANAVPGGREAINAHVRTFPCFGCPGGTVGVA